MADRYEDLALLIDGEWCSGSDSTTEDVLNPATEDVLGVLPHASRSDLDRALGAAQRGLAVWRATPPEERARILQSAGSMVRADAERIALTMSLEEGKPLREAVGEVLDTATLFEWMAAEALRLHGRLLPPATDGAIRVVSHEPVGVVLGLSPWNFPAILPAGKVAHALAAGCSIILKPAEESPGSAIAIARILERAGLPKGVLSIVFGVPSEVSSYLIASPVVRKIAFTGSVPVGKELNQLAAAGMKKVSLELGGHAPVIVFDDADIELAARASAEAKFNNAGQVCVAPSRFYLHEAIADEFAARFVDIAGSLKVGNGQDPETQMGPLANARRLQAMETFIADAEAQGARIRCGGKRIGNRGYFFEPTVLTDVPESARVMQVEPFGPIAPMARWRDFDDMVGAANGLPYGLTAYAFTRSQHRADAIAEALEVGMAGINTINVAGIQVPFGGVKQSGFGRVGGVEGLKEYTVTKTVSHRRA